MLTATEAFQQVAKYDLIWNYQNPAQKEVLHEELIESIPAWGDREREDWRDRCMSDLGFLAGFIFRKDLVKRTHRPIINHFISKGWKIQNENWVSAFANLSEIKNRLLLYPRGTYKSTLDVVDAAQWIIRFPDIRILFLTGDKDLAKGFLGELSDYFVGGEQECPREARKSGYKGIELGKPLTVFQLLFPEHCIAPKEKYERKFTTPARTYNPNKVFKEPTCEGNSLESSLSGRHYDVIKPDDAVTNENSTTTEALTKVRKNFYTSRKMLMAYGYVDGIGTRYNDLDLWGYMIEKEEEYELKEGFKNLILLQQAAYWRKPEFAFKTDQDEWIESECELLFPEVLTWQFLMKDRHDDPEAHACQYLNRPLVKKKFRATEHQIREHTLPWGNIPQNLKIFVQWDLAYSAKNKRDYTVGIVGGIDSQARLYILEVIRQRFPSGSELAYKIVETMKNWNPETTRIEESQGAQWLQTDLIQWAQKLNVELRIEYITIDNSIDAKEKRIQGVVEVLLPSNRVFFSTAITVYDDLMREFTKFTKTDDIPDAIGMLAQILPKTPTETPVQTAAEFEKSWELMRKKMAYELIYQIGEFLPKEEPPQKPVAEDTRPEKPRDYFGLGAD